MKTTNAENICSAQNPKRYQSSSNLLFHSWKSKAHEASTLSSVDLAYVLETLKLGCNALTASKLTASVNLCKQVVLWSCKTSLPVCQYFILASFGGFQVFSGCCEGLIEVVLNHFTMNFQVLQFRPVVTNFGPTWMFAHFGPSGQSEFCPVRLFGNTQMVKGRERVVLSLQESEV